MDEKEYYKWADEKSPEDARDEEIQKIWKNNPWLGLKEAFKKDENL